MWNQKFTLSLMRLRYNEILLFPTSFVKRMVFQNIVGSPKKSSVDFPTSISVFSIFHVASIASMQRKGPWGALVPIFLIAGNRFMLKKRSTIATYRVFLTSSIRKRATTSDYPISMKRFFCCLCMISHRRRIFPVSGTIFFLIPCMNSLR